MLVLPAVELRHPPHGVLVVQQAVDPALLFLAGDVQEKADHQIAVVAELALKPLDAVQALLELVFIQPAADPVPHGLFHPAGIQELQLAIFGDVGKIPPQPGAAAFGFGGVVKGDDVVKAGVQVADQLADQASLSRRAPALNEYDDGELVFPDGKLLGGKPLQSLGCQLFAECLVGAGDGFHLVQHRNVSFLKRQSALQRGALP